MKRIALLVVMIGLGLAPIARAQDHGEVGGFVEYFKLGDTSTNFVGLGGRAAFNVVHYVQIEAEMSYDFSRVFTEQFTNGATVTTANSNIRVLHGLIGPKIETPGPVRFFATIKGGGTNFRFDPVPASFSAFTSSVNNLRTSNVDAALYPGGGFEAFIGPVGLRLEVGDEIIFANGAHNNLKVSFGPQIRF